MPNLPKRKVGIVACSGEELPGGHGHPAGRAQGARAAAARPDGHHLPAALPGRRRGRPGLRQVLPDDRGGRLREALRGPRHRAATATSRPPASSWTSSWRSTGLPQPQGLRRLTPESQAVVDALADAIAAEVDHLMAVRWSRQPGRDPGSGPGRREASALSACACGSGIPVTTVELDGRTATIMALEPILELALQAGPARGRRAAAQILQTVQVYNDGGRGGRSWYAQAVGLAWQAYCAQRSSARASAWLRPRPITPTSSGAAEHSGHLVLGNGPEMAFSAPPDAYGQAGVLTPEDAFVAAANTCIMMMFLWACERFKIDLVDYRCRAEGRRRSSWTGRRSSPNCGSGRRSRCGRMLAATALRRKAGCCKALAAAQKYSLVANSVKSEIIVEPLIVIQKPAGPCVAETEQDG